MSTELSKSNIKTFRDLHAWQESHKLVLLTYALTKKFPKDELFALTSQLRRAVVSITSNLAEGFSRATYKDKANFYCTAIGSLTEAQNQFIIALDVKYISATEFEAAWSQSIIASKLINGLIKSTRSFSSLSHTS